MMISSPKILRPLALVLLCVVVAGDESELLSAEDADAFWLIFGAAL